MFSFLILLLVARGCTWFTLPETVSEPAAARTVELGEALFADAWEIRTHPVDERQKVGYVSIDARLGRGGVDFVADGMNSQGLSVSTLVSHNSRFQHPWSERELAESGGRLLNVDWTELAPHLLGTYATVLQALAALKSSIRVTRLQNRGLSLWTSTQWAINDAQGDYATVHYRKGELTYIYNEIGVLTDDHDHVVNPNDLLGDSSRFVKTLLLRKYAVASMVQPSDESGILSVATAILDNVRTDSKDFDSWLKGHDLEPPQDAYDLTQYDVLKFPLSGKLLVREMSSSWREIDLAKLPLHRGSQPVQITVSEDRVVADPGLCQGTKCASPPESLSGAQEERMPRKRARRSSESSSYEGRDRVLGVLGDLRSMLLEDDVAAGST